MHMQLVKMSKTYIRIWITKINNRLCMHSFRDQNIYISKSFQAQLREKNPSSGIFCTEIWKVKCSLKKKKSQRRAGLIISTISDVIVFCRSEQSSECVSERLDAWIGRPLLSRGGLIAALTELIDEEWGQDSMLPAQGNRASQISHWYYSTLLANML